MSPRIKSISPYLVFFCLLIASGSAKAQTAKTSPVVMPAITDSAFQKTIHDNPVLLADFYETYCGACRMQALIIDSISEDQKGKVKVLKVDVDKSKDLITKMQIYSYPTILLYKNGKQVWRSEGIMPRSYIMEAIKNQN